MILPFFALARAGRPAILVSKISSVAVNTSGIVNGALYIILRGNMDRISAQATRTTPHDRSNFQIFGPSRIYNPRVNDSPRLLESSGTDGQGYDPEKRCLPFPVFSPVEQGSNVAKLQFLDETPCRPWVEERSSTGPTPRAVIKRKSIPTIKVPKYSLFPPTTSAPLRNSMSTVFSLDDEDMPQPPPPLFSQSHKRDLSEETSATVQIGLRLSSLSRALESIGRSAPTSPLRAHPPNNSLFNNLSNFASQPSNQIAESPRPKRPSIWRSISSPGMDKVEIATQEGGEPLPSSHAAQRGPRWLSPNWKSTRDRSASQRKRRCTYGTMKSLPPLPPNESLPKSPPSARNWI